MLGCTDCGCLPGASLGPACEHDPAGQCDCIDDVGGRTCDTPHPGYFIPKMDYIQVQSSADLMVCTFKILYAYEFLDKVFGSCIIHRVTTL